jgi:ferritin-like metal-binding protein YciE
VKAATCADLQKAFGDHLKTTISHVTGLENIFDLLGQKPEKKNMIHCKELQIMQLRS